MPLWAIPGAELLLVGAIVLLYLQDGLLLLRPNEAVLMRNGRGHWRAGFGARLWKLADKEPHLANPFLPHRPVYRLAWPMHASKVHLAAQTGAKAMPLQVNAALGWLAPFAWLSWVLLLAVIPAALMARLGLGVLLWVLALLYLNIAAGLLATWLWRERLGLSSGLGPGVAPRRFALLAFECLACAPYSINLVRRVAWAQPQGEDFVAAAGRLLAPAQLALAHRECLARIDEQLDAVPEGSELAQALQAGRLRFELLAAAEPD